MIVCVQKHGTTAHRRSIMYTGLTTILFVVIEHFIMVQMKKFSCSNRLKENLSQYNILHNPKRGILHDIPHHGKMRGRKR